MIVKTSIKGNNILCDCCNKNFTDTIMKHYEIGGVIIILSGIIVFLIGLSIYLYYLNTSFECPLCKECEKQLFNISKVDTIKKVITVDNNIYY